MKFDEENAALQSDGYKTALKIIQESKGYQVCYGCETVVSRAFDICPHCHSYRFDVAGAAAKALRVHCLSSTGTL
jgi:Zn finger protein HypA/HybF involved in hydrogenase expression